MTKCKFWKKCKLYYEESVTCNKEGGMYYGEGSPAGCYRTMEEKESSNKRIKDNRKNSLIIFVIWAVFFLFILLIKKAPWEDLITFTTFGFIVSMVSYALIYTPKRVIKQINKKIEGESNDD